jgi:hypothetical protein
MQFVKSLVVSGVLMIGVAAAACASEEPNDGSVRLATLVNGVGVQKKSAPKNASSSPTANLSLRGGAMVTPRGAGLAGVDFMIPSLSVGSDWQGRIDADVIFKANFGGINTIVPVTVDLIHTDPNGVSGHSIYYGGGLGAVLGGKALFDGKLIIGAQVTQKVSAELNVHFTEHDTLLTLMARLHL